MSKEIDKLDEAYQDLIKPESLVKDMSYDEFMEWLELGTKEDIQAALKRFEETESGMQHHCEIMRIKLKSM